MLRYATCAPTVRNLCSYGMQPVANEPLVNRKKNRIAIQKSRTSRKTSE